MGTSTGLKKSDMHKNKRGKIVTKAQSAAGKGLQAHRGLDRRREEGEGRTGTEGLHCHQEGHAAVQEGEGALPEVSSGPPGKARAQAPTPRRGNGTGGAP